MAQLSGSALRHARAVSWRGRAKEWAKQRPLDLDGQFIFSWIAFNALYGQARYRESDDRRPSEMGDIVRFLKLMLQLDTRGVSAILQERDLRAHFDCLVRDKFLHDCCWKLWDRDKIVSRDQREAHVPECSERHDHPLVQLFRRLYVLRKQIFHGCSKDGSSKNRPSLRAATPVLSRLVDVFTEILLRRQDVESVTDLLGAPPYPPTQDNARWNAARLVRDR